MTTALPWAACQRVQHVTLVWQWRCTLHCDVPAGFRAMGRRWHFQVQSCQALSDSSFGPGNHMCMEAEHCRPGGRGFRLGETSQGSHSTAADILLMFLWCAGLAFVCCTYLSLSGIPQLEVWEVCTCVHVWEHGNKHTITCTLKLKWFPATLKCCELQLHTSP